MNVRTLIWCVAAPIWAFVTVGCILVGQLLSPGMAACLSAAPWIMTAFALLPLIGCHVIAWTRTPVCRFGAPFGTGVALYVMLTAMIASAVGGLTALAAAEFFDSPGLAVGSVALAGAMAGAIHMFLVPGIGFEWTPVLPKPESPANASGSLWMLRPRRRSAAGPTFDARFRRMSSWGAWGLALVSAYVPVGAMALLPAFLSDAAEAGHPAKPAADRWMVAITAIAIFLAVRLAIAILGSLLAEPQKSTDRENSGRAARVLSTIAIGGIGLTLASALIVQIPFYWGFAALLIAFVASESQFFMTLLGDPQGLRWPAESAGDSGSARGSAV